MLSGKRLLLLGFIVVLLIVIPLTVYLVQQQQKLRVGANPLTTLSLSPASVTKAVGDQFSEDINIVTGVNQVSFVKLTINFDTTKLQPAALGTTACPKHPDFVLCPNDAIFTTDPLQGPTVNGGSITVTLSVGQDPSKAISTTTPTRIATVGFKALAATTAPTQITFAFDQTQTSPTQVLSIGTADQFNENVLVGQPSPASVTITETSAVSPGAGSTSSNKIPVCTNLAIDRSATGTAPYALTFTATGNDPDGTISKVTFQFGDGQTADVTTGGGIGTASVNVASSHQYNNPGTFTAKAILTDNQSGISNGSCMQTITVTAATGGTAGTAGTSAGGPSTTTQTVTVASATPSATPIVIATPIPTPIPTLAPTGPGDKFISVGTLGIISTIIGVIILFAL